MTAAASPATTIARIARWRSGRLGGRGVLRVVDLEPADPRRDRAGHPGPDAGRLERGDGQERRRRLAVRAGDPDDRQVVARIAVPPGRRAGERGACLGDDELGQVDVGDGVVDEGGGRAPGRGARDEVVAVDVEPGDGHEQRPVADLRGSRGSRRGSGSRPGRPRRSRGRRGGRRGGGPPP